MRLVTWNVNSLKARMPRVLQLLEEVGPDVVCLQETKAEAAAFPADELAEAGYEAAHHSGGRWAGVAVLARSGRARGEEVHGLPGEARPEEARWVEAEVDGVRVISTYVVNGREVDSPWFAEKLAFLDAMAARVRALREARPDQPVVLAGDLNVCRDDRDVYDPAAFAGSTHVTAQERERLEALLDAGGLVDAYRDVDPDGQLFTWWDYRAGHFHKGLGLRIDYVLAGGLEVRDYAMLRDFRKGSKPSDHAPVLVELGRP
ncbi:exodeoxyribonuclease III [Conexibacter sp. SYSU D00693]|uniref:exodeoxyribonuclease III n=1 Tax=Conexibacter sp. SYSU D00693 TaxID=2812560 RepID=UPI00196B9DA0|nr:exodeoxyribonuclease III [Conexibacter sp. SYSU D00693]